MNEQLRERAMALTDAATARAFWHLMGALNVIEDPTLASRVQAMVESAVDHAEMVSNKTGGNQS